MHHFDATSEEDEDECPQWVNAVKSKDKQAKDTKMLHAYQ